MYKSRKDLENASYQLVTDLRHPKEGIALAGMYKKGGRIGIVENGAEDNVLLFDSVKAALKFIRQEYGFAYMRKAEYMVRGGSR